MEFVVHLLLPHHSNNHRPRVLHHQSLLILFFTLLIFGFSLSFVKTRAPAVLGLATDVTVSKLVELTNQERIKNGLPPLFFDIQLSKAAQGKANDMFLQNYWAHNTPNGYTPWSFILNSGYQYINAGENLARDFNNSREVVSAWMESPGHKANILSPNYQDIGVAIANGRLNGQETTLIVQFFGTRKGATPEISEIRVFGAEAPFQKPLISSHFLTRNITLSILAFLIVILAIDVVIAYRRRLIRLVGHNLDHIIFLGSLIPIIIITRGGSIL